MLTRRGPSAGGSAVGAKLFAWIAGSKSGNDERKNERKIGSRTPTDAIGILPWHRPRPRLSAERRTSIGVPPRFSPQGVFHRKGLSLRPGFLGRGGTRFAHPFERALPAPACPSPAKAPRTLVVVLGG